MNQLKLLTRTMALTTALTTVALGQQYKQTNIDSNVSGAASNTDTNLINPWGISRSSGGAWWVADTGTGLSTLYNGAGTKESLVVTIPKGDPSSTAFPHGTPTGTVFNGDPAIFLLGPGKPAAFLFANLDGSLAAWNPEIGLAPGAAAPSTQAVTVFKGKIDSSYTGLTSAQINGRTYLFAANFGLGRVDVFDSGFGLLSAEQLIKLSATDNETEFENPPIWQRERFSDDRLPPNYFPYNVQAIGSDIVVTYALHPAGKPGKEIDGPGLGYVDVYSSSGKLLSRLEHGIWLNAPWGVALAPTDFGVFSHDLLVAQFGGGGTSESAGLIAAYDLATGKFKGLLKDAAGSTLSIPGIWALSPGNVAPNNLDPAASPAAAMYFSAGPSSGGGFFGYLSAVPTTLIQGNDQ